MPITSVDKVKIAKYMKDTPMGDIYYLDLCDALAKRQKITDIEFLEYFTDSVVSEFRKDKKISMKQVSKLVVTIQSFLKWVHESETEVDEKILDSIRSFEEYYDDYLNRTNVDIDLEFTDGPLADIIKTVDELYPCKDNRESVLQYLNEIDDLDKQLAALKRDFDSLNSQCEHLKKHLEQTTRMLTTKSEELGKANQSIVKKDKDITELIESICELEKRISELKSSLEQVKEERDDLAPYKEKYFLLESEVKKLREALERIEQTEKYALKQREEETMIEAIMYDSLLDGTTMDSIKRRLSSDGYEVERDKLQELLARIRRRINIVTPSFGRETRYQIVEPRVLEDGTFDISLPVGCKCYDILLVADYHVRDIEDCLEELDKVNNYCVNNNISLVINLGDFYNGFGEPEARYDSAVSSYRCVEKAISLIPKANGVYHAVLGGNHDKRLLKYGFDPIEMMALEREDFINLGYSHSTITLNGCRSLYSSFDLHHPQGQFFNLKLGEEGIDSELIHSYLSGLYEKNGDVRDNSFVDIFGHTHKSQINLMDSYVFVPSLLEGKIRRGATHLRIYFDEENLIDYILFIPLSVSDKLVRTTEVVYQKMLRR